MVMKVNVNFSENDFFPDWSGPKFPEQWKSKSVWQVEISNVLGVQIYRTSKYGEQVLGRFLWYVKSTQETEQVASLCSILNCIYIYIYIHWTHCGEKTFSLKISLNTGDGASGSTYELNGCRKVCSICYNQNNAMLNISVATRIRNITRCIHKCIRKEILYGYTVNIIKSFRR